MDWGRQIWSQETSYAVINRSRRKMMSLTSAGGCEDKGIMSGVSKWEHGSRLPSRDWLDTMKIWQEDSLWLRGRIGVVVIFIERKNTQGKANCVGKGQWMSFGQNGAWGLRDSDVLTLYLETDVPALRSWHRAFLLCFWFCSFCTAKKDMVGQTYDIFMVWEVKSKWSSGTENVVGPR